MDLGFQPNLSQLLNDELWDENNSTNEEAMFFVQQAKMPFNINDVTNSLLKRPIPPLRIHNKRRKKETFPQEELLSWIKRWNLYMNEEENYKSFMEIVTVVISVETSTSNLSKKYEKELPQLKSKLKLSQKHKHHMWQCEMLLIFPMLENHYNKCNARKCNCTKIVNEFMSKTGNKKKTEKTNRASWNQYCRRLFPSCKVLFKLVKEIFVQTKNLLYFNGSFAKFSKILEFKETTLEYLVAQIKGSVLKK